jgi:hypothetical protein
MEIGVPPERVVDELETEIGQVSSPAKRTSVNVQQFRDSVDKMLRIRQLLTSSVRDPAVNNLIHPRELRKFREQLLRNHKEFNDVYTLPPCPGVSERALVLLLRHISSCDMRCLQLAYSCVTSREWQAQVARVNPDVPALKYFRDKPERIARLKSPYVENVISRFATLFIRIGVPDLTKTQFTSLMEED